MSRNTTRPRLVDQVPYVDEVGWGRVVGAFVTGILLLVGGAQLALGECESFEVAGHRPSFQCAPDGQGSIAANAAGLTLIAIGVVALGIVGAVLTLELRRDSTAKNGRSRRRGGR